MRQALKISALNVTIIVFGLSGCWVIATPNTEQLFEAQRLLNQGTVHLRKAELEQAEAAFRIAYEIAPGAAALDGLGSVAFLQSDFKKAERFFLKAHQIEPNYARA